MVTGPSGVLLRAAGFALTVGFPRSFEKLCIGMKQTAFVGVGGAAMRGTFGAPMQRRPSFSAPLLILLSLLGVALAPAAKAQEGLTLREVADGGIRVDGMLRDWRRAPRITLGRGDDASMRFVLGYTADGMYLAASVKDERLIRDGLSKVQDAVVITLATPGRRGFQATEIYVFPGRPGEAAAVASGNLRARRLRPVRGAQAVEAVGQDGYELEAFVPWSAFAGGRRWQEGRIAVRLQDVDREARPEIENQPATARVDGANLERLPQVRTSGGQDNVLRRFLASQDMDAARPQHDLRGDVSGDNRPERVVLVGRYVVVFGPGYRNGQGYDFAALPVQNPSDISEVQLRDFTGAGKKQLALRMRQRGGRGGRDVWQLYAFSGEAIAPLFGIELRKETAAGHVESRMRIRGRGRPTIEVTAGRAQGLTPENFQERSATDAQGILLPWGPVLSRSYRWDGQRFATVRERANPNPYDPAAAAAERQANARRERTEDEASRRADAQRQAAANAPGVDDMLRVVRRERGLRGRGRFQRQVNVAEGREAETVVMYGNALVVVGPGFRGGNSYFLYSVPGTGEVLDLQTADLNGDGRQEILLRATQQIGDIQREVLMVHRFARDGSFPRMASIEVARQQGSNRVENEVRAARGRLEVRPGRARGWTEASWPWGPSEGGDVAPLLLPWRDRAVRYRVVNGALVPR